MAVGHKPHSGWASDLSIRNAAVSNSLARLPTQVLVADDDENDVLLIRAAFEKAGLDYPIEAVSNGMDCIAYLNGDRPYDDRSKYPLPTLLLLDVKMPLMDGFEVLTWIRHRPDFNYLRVVMLTGAERTGDAKLAYDLGSNSFFVKPFDFENADELFDAVRKLLKNAR